VRVAGRADQALGLDLDQAQIERICSAAKPVDADTRGDASKKLDKLVKAVAADQLGKPGLALRGPPAHPGWGAAKGGLRAAATQRHRRPGLSAARAHAVPLSPLSR
jgi:hypothetical protein